jgi:ribosomal peptide maturation radical SAM protein 1
MTQVDVALICMPWAVAVRPSIALGILKGVLDDAGIACEVYSYHLGFADHLSQLTRDDEHPLTLADYQDVAETFTAGGAGDWCFSVPPYRAPDPVRDQAYLKELGTHSVVDPRDRLLQIRELVPDFLDNCVREIVAAAPRIVGFSSTFCQNVPSLVLALMIKQRLPDTTIVFGGSNCDGAMGAALHRCFSWIDIVVRGEGERVFPAVIRQLLAGEPLDEQPGLCFRRGDKIVEVPETSSTVALEEAPMPNYDEYFARLGTSGLATEMRTMTSIPFEAARGCWWGAKHHCTFCGLNGQTMKFRSKSPHKVFAELGALASKYRCLTFFAVDNIIDTAYFSSLLPWLKDTGWNTTLFFETKANLKRADVKALSDAGVRVIQPGIESLSSSVLSLMRKGVTALINIRLLKLCAEYEVVPRWNLLYGFPGESAEAYAEMAQIVPSLTHLFPPTAMGALRVDRFSPYFVEREQLDMRVVGPQWFYHHIYDVADSDLFDLAYFFNGEPLVEMPSRPVYAELRRVVDSWIASQDTTYRRLRYQIGPDFVVIQDLRPGVGPARYVLDRVEALIYLACDAGATPSAVLRMLGDANDGRTVDEIREFLDELVDARLMFREHDHYLGLAVCADPANIERFLAVGAEPARAEPAPAGDAREPRLIPLRRNRSAVAVTTDVVR